MRYGSVAAMIAWLDREEIAKMRMRRMRKIVRRLPPRERAFALALKRVLVDIPGSEDLHREKIMKALKIKRRMYLYQLSALHKTLARGTMGGGACDSETVSER